MIKALENLVSGDSPRPCLQMTVFSLCLHVVERGIISLSLSLMCVCVCV